MYFDLISIEKRKFKSFTHEKKSNGKKQKKKKFSERFNREKRNGEQIHRTKCTSTTSYCLFYQAQLQKSESFQMDNYQDVRHFNGISSSCVNIVQIKVGFFLFQSNFSFGYDSQWENRLYSMSSHFILIFDVHLTYYFDQCSENNEYVSISSVFSHAFGSK